MFSCVCFFLFREVSVVFVSWVFRLDVKLNFGDVRLLEIFILMFRFCKLFSMVVIVLVNLLEFVVVIMSLDKFILLLLFSWLLVIVSVFVDVSNVCLIEVLRCLFFVSGILLSSNLVIC